MAEMLERTPSETLMNCLTDFGEAEPTRVLVIWTDVDGNICWSTSAPRSVTAQVGMLECVKALMVQSLLSARG